MEPYLACNRIEAKLVFDACGRPQNLDNCVEAETRESLAYSQLGKFTRKLISILICGEVHSLLCSQHNRTFLD